MDRFSGLAQRPQNVLQQGADQAAHSGTPLVTVVSASGGVGCSSIALLVAWMAAEGGVKTSLMECDLQFGDYASWLSLAPELTGLEAGVQAIPIALTNDLQLYRAPSFPEQADQVEDEIGTLVSYVRAGCGLVVADAGGYWSGMTAELVINASMVLLVFDARLSSMAGASKAAQLCQRLGVPSACITAIYNKSNGKGGISPKEAARIVGVRKVVCIPDGKATVESLLSTGEISALCSSSNPMSRGVRGMVSFLLPKLGCTSGAKGRG